MSGHLWGASYMQRPEPPRGAGQGAYQWASSLPPHPPGCSDPFSPFLKVGFRMGSQLPLSSVAFVNFCRLARLHCLGDFMFDFQGHVFDFKVCGLLGFRSIRRRHDKRKWREK